MRNCFHGSEQPMNSRTQNEPGVRLHGSFPGWVSDFTDHALRLMVKKALPESISAEPFQPASIQSGHLEFSISIDIIRCFSAS